MRPLSLRPEASKDRSPDLVLLASTGWARRRPGGAQVGHAQPAGQRDQLIQRPRRRRGDCGADTAACAVAAACAVVIGWWISSRPTAARPRLLAHSRPTWDPRAVATFHGVGTRRPGRTIAALEALGQQPLAPPLPLDDPDAGPRAHAEAVVEAVRHVAGRLVVVGQSLGAFTASGRRSRAGRRAGARGADDPQAERDCGPVVDGDRPRAGDRAADSTHRS